MTGTLERAQQMSHETAGKVAVAIGGGFGGGRAALDYATELAAWADVFLKFGNTFAFFVGMYLVLPKAIARWKMNRCQKRRADDDET